MCLVGFVLTSVAQAQAGRPNEVTRKGEPYWILLEPGQVIVRKPAYRFAEGRRTLARPALIKAGEFEIEPYGETDWKTLRIGWDAFQKRAGKAAEARLGELTPRYLRDPATGRAVYAEIRMEQPVLAGFMLAPSFPKLFEKELGKRLAVVIPTTRRMFVFSADSNAVFEHGEELQSIYEAALYPVSREIFLFEKGTLRVVGMLGEEEVQPLPLPK